LNCTHFVDIRHWSKERTWITYLRAYCSISLLIRSPPKNRHIKIGVKCTAKLKNFDCNNTIVGRQGFGHQYLKNTPDDNGHLWNLLWVSYAAEFGCYAPLIAV
jgi:hypothetical protein